MTEERICHVYLNHTNRDPGEGTVVTEDVGGGKTEQVEVCGTRLLSWRDTGIFYCPTCDRLDAMLPLTDPGTSGIL